MSTHFRNFWNASGATFFIVFNNRFSVVAVCAMSIFLSACSTVDPYAAAKLAGKGSDTAENGSKLYSERADQLERYLECECVLSAISDGYAAPSDKMVVNVDSVKRIMILRSDMFAKLAETYASFEKLALYDDGGEFESSIRGLSDSLNEYSVGMGNAPVATSADADLAALAGRGLFSAYHKSRIVKASSIIRGRLEAIIELLSDPVEKKAVLAMERVEERAKLKLALALWKQGLALPDAIVNTHIETYGLVPNKSVTMRQIDRSTTGKMAVAVAKVLKFRHRREISARERAYGLVIAALKGLVEAHRALERGVPPSWKAISEHLRKIREYTEKAGGWWKGGIRESVSR